MKRAVPAISLTLALGLTAVACGGGNDPPEDRSPTPDAAGRPSSPAELTILEPEPGSVTPAGSIPVRLRLENAELVEQVTTDITPDEGHVHLSLDGEVLTLLGGLEEDLSELAEEPLEPGPHLLEAEFVAADHGFFSPRVITSVTFTVE